MLVGAGPRLTDLPPDVLAEVLVRCTPRAQACLASTCRALRALERAETRALPVVTLTAAQRYGVLRWVVAHAPRVRHLVARRCLFGQEAWLRCMTRLETLTLAFCHVDAGVLASLPAGLSRLDLHRVQPRADPADPVEFEAALVAGRDLSFKKFGGLRALALTLTGWNVATVRGLPRGLTALSVRADGGTLAVLSAFPRGLRHVVLESRQVWAPNRLPRGLRSLRIRSTTGRLPAGFRDGNPAPRGLERLDLDSRVHLHLTELAGLTRLTALRARAPTAVADLDAVAALPRLRDVEIHAETWLTLPRLGWPGPRPPPDRLVLTVRGVRQHLPVHAQVLPAVPAPFEVEAA